MPEHLNLKSSKKVSEQLRHQLELWVEISLVTHLPAQAGLVQSGVRDLGVYVTCNMFLLLPPILPNPQKHTWKHPDESAAASWNKTTRYSNQILFFLSVDNYWCFKICLFFFWSWPRASFWIEPGGLFDLPGGVGGVGVWVNVAGGPLAGGLVVVTPFFGGNKQMGGNSTNGWKLLNRVKRDSNLGLVRLDPLVLWHSDWSFWPWTTHVEYLYKPWFLFRRLQSVRHLSFPAPDAFFRFLDDFIPGDSQEKTTKKRKVGESWILSFFIWASLLPKFLALQAEKPAFPPTFPPQPLLGRAS